MPLPTFATGEPMTAVAANTLARQGIITVGTSLERDALPGPHAGMACFVESEDAVYIYLGGQWQLWWLDTDWVEITLINGWTASPSSMTPAVRRQGNTVAMLGRVTGGTDPVIATLEPRFRPLRQQHQDVVRDGGANNITIVIVQTNGNVSVGGGPTAPNLDTVWFR